MLSCLKTRKNSFDKILITRDYSSGAGLVFFICM